MKAEQLFNRSLLYDAAITEEVFREVERKLLRIGYRWYGLYQGYEGFKNNGRIKFYDDMEMQTAVAVSYGATVTVEDILGEPKPFRSVTELMPEQEMLHLGLGITEERADELYQHLIDQEVSAENYLAMELEEVTSVCTNINEVAYVTFMYANAYTKKALFADSIASINMLMDDGEE